MNRISESGRRGRQQRKHRVAAIGFVVAAFLVGIAPATAGGNRSAPPQRALRPQVRLSLRSPVIDLFQSASISVSGISAREAEVRLLGAIDVSGPAYQWTPYPWRPLRRVHDTWHGVLPAPALHGTYQLELRLDHGRTRLSSPTWLMRVYPRDSLTRRSFPTPQAALRDYVAHLPGGRALVALRRWPMATFDHRNPQLHRLFVVAYAPKDDNRTSSRLGMFITTVRDSYHGHWRILEATTEPND